VPSELPPLSFVEALTPDAIEKIRTMMLADEMWQSLARLEPPGRGKMQLLFANKKYAGHLVRRTDTDEDIAFVLLDIGRLASRGDVEVDVGIPDVRYRGMGLSKLALAMAFDAWLRTDRCTRMWGWIDVSNAASLAMVRALEIPEVARGQENGRTTKGLVDTVDVAITKDEWERARKKLRLEQILGP
jgi:hypothetical protein